MGTMRVVGSAVFALGVGLGVVAAAAPAVGSQQGQASYLFVINSQRGTIEGIGADTGKERMRLTLRGVSDHATQFTDRPIRKAYVLSTRDLTSRWSRWFKGNPPNAVLTFSKAKDAMPHSIVVKLTKPRYDAQAETLEFTARHIHRRPDLSPEAEQRIPLPKRRPPATFQRGSLFIDVVVDGPVINGCPIQSYTQCPGVDLSGQTLKNASLAHANLSDSNLRSANLTNAWLLGANLTGANLTSAILAGAGLSQANLTNVNLYHANLSGAYLSGANLSGAYLVGANFAGANLSGATWNDGRRCAVDPGDGSSPPVYTGRCL